MDVYGLRYVTGGRQPAVSGRCTEKQWTLKRPG